MGESTAQSKLIFYLLKVLEWMYRAEGWFVVSNLNIYQRRRAHEYPLAPDVAVFKGIRDRQPGDRTLRSWRLYEPGRTPPQVVFEISSKETWREDLEDKPAKYAALGCRNTTPTSRTTRRTGRGPAGDCAAGGRRAGRWWSRRATRRAGCGARSWRAGWRRMARCCGCMTIIGSFDSPRARPSAQRKRPSAAKEPARERGGLGQAARAGDRPRAAMNRRS